MVRFGVLLFASGLIVAQTRQPGFSLSNLDRNADPCVDFYRYACGNWMATNPIPADESDWSQFDQLQERNRLILRKILDQDSAENPQRDPVSRQLGDFYYSCTDEETINKKGLTPLRPELDRISAISGKGAIVDELVRLHRIGTDVFFNFDAGPDFKNAKINIAQASQGGLGLPDRDYYLKDDAASVTLRKQYVEHVRKMMELLDEDSAAAVADAQAVMSIETDLAKGSLDNVTRRDPQKIYHKMTEQELFSMAPFMDWPKYFAGMGAPKIDTLNVESPNFFRTLESVMVQHDLKDLKSYMRWHFAHSEARWLPAAFVNENFRFYGTILQGTQELSPRWRRCVNLADSDLGEALGRKYVELTFGPQGKERTLKMVDEIEHAMRSDIEKLSWMTPATKKEALVKLAAVTNKIGYPDQWRDYSSVKVQRDDLLGNDERATEFEVRRHMNKIGKPVDRKEWEMTPPTVNAYYDPLQNNINFPAGILQPPFYDNQLDDAVNYGGIGAVVGHELTHGFDDEGRQFGPDGNLHDWWTPEDAKEFEKRAECFVKEYAAFEPLPGVHLNGKLTLGENTADNGGLRLAFTALMESLNGKKPAKIDGFTPEQRLFLGFGQVWCENTREEMAKMMAQTNPHSPGKARVNGVVSNMPEFRQAFACKLGQPMVPEPACRVW
jgi:putative endopeptidase